MTANLLGKVSIKTKPLQMDAEDLEGEGGGGKWREGGGNGGREEGGKEEGREGGKEGGREGGREGRREGGREGGREGDQLKWMKEEKFHYLWESGDPHLFHTSLETKD